MKKSIIALVAACALLPAAGHATDPGIGGAIAGTNMKSFSGGAIAGGNVNLSGAGFGGGFVSQHTQAAHNDGLAGTIAKIDRTPHGTTLSIVSEHQLNGWTQSTNAGATFGPSLTVNLSGAVQGGVAFSSGELAGVLGGLHF